MHLRTIFHSDNPITKGYNSTNLRPRCPSRIKQRIASIQQIRMLLTTVNAHAVFKDGHIKQHLHPIIFFRLNLALDGIFIRLTRLHFNERTHVTLHIVEATLNAQSLTNIRRLKYGIRLVKVVTRSQESFHHRLTDMFKMHSAVIEKRLFLLRVKQILASGQFNRILFKSLLHASHVIRLFIRRMYPFVQKKVGDVTQQQRTCIVYRHQPTHQIVGRMTSIIPIAFRQSANVYQIIRVKDDKRRGICSVFIPFHIQKIQLGMTPIILNTFRKLIVYPYLVVSDLPIIFRDFIYRSYIKKFIIRILKANPNASIQYIFLPFHRTFQHSPRKNFRQFFGYRSMKHHLNGLSHRTYITRKFLSQRFFPMIHHIIRSQAKSMQSIFQPSIKRKLS